jgi:hypothetical protein
MARLCDRAARRASGEPLEISVALPDCQRAREPVAFAGMIYLVVGLDRRTLGPWHRNVGAGDVAAAKRLARVRARAAGVDLVVAAVIGPCSSVLDDPAEEAAGAVRAA